MSVRPEALLPTVTSNVLVLMDDEESKEINSETLIHLSNLIRKNAHNSAVIEHAQGKKGIQFGLNK